MLPALAAKVTWPHAGPPGPLSLGLALPIVMPCPGLQPKLGKRSYAILTSSVFFLPPLCHTELLLHASLYIFFPLLPCLDTLLLMQGIKKVILTAALLPCDMNTMREITANFYELSHHLQLINSCYKGRRSVSPRRTPTSSVS